MARKKVTAASWAKDPINYLSITPLDGRNYHKISQLSDYFSEFAINKARLLVEIEYLIYIAREGVIGGLGQIHEEKMRDLYRKFGDPQLKKVKDWETKTNHDVKAVEYYLKAELENIGIGKIAEMVHWGLTSEDVNNLAINLNVRNYIQEEQLTIVASVVESLVQLIKVSDSLMLGRTHGQAAGVTTMAKEMAVYLDRILGEYEVLKEIEIEGKVSGVVGTMADQGLAVEEKDWSKIANGFVRKLGLKPALASTQILPYESLIRVFDSIATLQNIAVDLVKNLWWYVSFDYFVQAKKDNEVGSSTLPHKVNPIYLEGAEGGFELSTAILEFYKRKLGQSRLQRDLSDSTVRRSMGVAFGYSYLSWQSVVEAIQRLAPNSARMKEDLEKHYEIMSGPVQNWLKYKGYKKPYEILLEKIRGKQLNQKEYKRVIRSLKLSKSDEKYLLGLSFEKLRGESDKIVASVVARAMRAVGRREPMAVVGLQWGDEGKGKLIDYLGEQYDTTIRYNGGNNAGHTVKVGKTVLHMSLIPSSVLHKKKVMISQAVVINPAVLINEIRMLKKLGFDPRLTIDPRCHVVLPYHQQMDAASEWYKGKKKQTGSLKLGIGFTYEDRTNRAGIRMADLINPKRLKARINEEWKLKELRVTRAYGAEFDADIQSAVDSYTDFGRELKQYVGDVSSWTRENIERESVLFESAQGAYLDFVYGSYPYTVAYHTIAPAIMADVGLPARKIDVMGIVKAYTTRVGNGPFLAEQDNKIGQYMRDRGHEYGTVSGRPRRCGWLDLPMIKQAIAINGVTEIALTKIDVLSGLSKIKVVTGYQKKGEIVDYPPADDEEAETMKPIYKTFDGWSKEISKIREYEKLPIEARAYVGYIEDEVGIKIRYVSVGPDRAETIIRDYI